jgi:hypothetical protein
VVLELRKMKLIGYYIHTRNFVINILVLRVLKQRTELSGHVARIREERIAHCCWVGNRLGIFSHERSGEKLIIKKIKSYVTEIDSDMTWMKLARGSVYWHDLNLKDLTLSGKLLFLPRHLKPEDKVPVLN